MPQLDKIDTAHSEPEEPLLPNQFDTPAIVSTPNVCGGEPRIIHTRIPVWVLEKMRRVGFPEAEILQSYPNLTFADLNQAWTYVAQHQEKIEKALRENEEA